MLMYYREYRTQFHIGVTYGISESRVCEIIKETECILISMDLILLQLYITLI
jgi:DNA-directed RNA polymerase specialized sigma subunit